MLSADLLSIKVPEKSQKGQIDLGLAEETRMSTTENESCTPKDPSDLENR